MKPLICHKLDQSVSTIRLAFTNEQFNLSSLQYKILSTEMEQKLIFAVILGEIRKHVAIELKL